jgi:hypothetical protein
VHVLMALLLELKRKQVVKGALQLGGFTYACTSLAKELSDYL